MTSDMDKYFPSRFLRASLLEGPTKMTIAKVGEELVENKGVKELVPAAEWSEDAKPLILNKTNFQAIAKIAGTEAMKDWGGTVVELFTITGDFFGEIREVIRIRAPTPTTKAKEGK